ncbi:uncharacterized protein LOC127796615 [Diospyros lotus]|uniref:uncharacterized protein LOC127796615 n=1 Tax=Diospyros lotus TaxID=55363 RepID=UPI002252832B|nr:uncharacterized protein LOC127796615 [Diospyros lotus]
MELPRRVPVAVHGGGKDLATSSWLPGIGGTGGGGCRVGGYSQETERDLASMVRDFLECGSSGNESWYSSDSDSGPSDLASIADEILLHKQSVDQYERDLISVVHSLILSIDETDHQFNSSYSCNASYIRFLLVMLLQSLGYDAAICTTKWQGVGKIPGGEHEFIDVINHNDDGCSERYIVDIDFRSHFEIARAVRSYDVVLGALPTVYAGSMSKLRFFLQAMVGAARCSLKQNSMPLPPWRSLAYLQAKWESTCQRVIGPYNKQSTEEMSSCPHQQCSGLLRRLKSCIESEIRAGMKNEGKERLQPERWRNFSSRAW